MGTVVTLDVRPFGPRTDPSPAVRRAFDWLHRVDAIFSTYRWDSEISRLERGDLDLAGASADVRSILARCEDLKARTGGYFDVRAVAGALDPSGLVKGWAAQQASAMLRANGVDRHCLNAGGDVAVCGGTRQHPWRVGIVHPLHPDALTTVVEITDGAVATSGTYERGHHIYDPHTNRPATALASVTIVGADLALADAYATAALAMGLAAPGWLAELAATEGYESYVIDAGGFAWWTPGFAGIAPGLPPAAGAATTGPPPTGREPPPERPWSAPPGR
ncbi:MAG TPA: FAD:protein FMN transferase [Actinomycetota bacterium]|nr:FAD:protein FMN transferase [Actinomycetota bacterium]